MESSCKSCSRPLNVAEQKDAVRCSACRNKLCGDCQALACGSCDSIMCVACLNSCAGDCSKKFCKACLTSCSNPKCRNSLCAGCLAFFILPCSKCEKHICKICALCSSCSGECRVITCEVCGPPPCAGHCGERFCVSCAEKCLNHKQCGNVTFCGSCIPTCRGGCGRKLCKSCGQACKTCGGCICTECAGKLTCCGKDCNKLFCPQCVPSTCKHCGRAFCTECVVNCSGCDRPMCVPCSRPCCAPSCKRRLCDLCVDSEQASCQNKCGQFFCSPCGRSNLRNACMGPCGGTNFCRNCLSTCQGEGCQARFCSSCLKGRYSCYTCNLSSLCQACATRDHFAHNCFAITRSSGEEEAQSIAAMEEEEEEDGDGTRSLRRRLHRNGNIFYTYADSSRYQGEMVDHLPHGKGVWTHPKFHRATFEVEPIAEERTRRKPHVPALSEGPEGTWETAASENARRGSQSKPSKRRRPIQSAAEEKVVEMEVAVVGAPVSSAVLLFFEGDWVHGLKCGEGTATFLNGMRYRGHWRDGKRHGKGELLHASLRVYEGDWEADCKHGTGTQRLADGSVYEGGWQENKRHGDGRLSNNEGEYTGQWQHDHRQGQGTQAYSADGTVYKGLWQNDARHGKGRLSEPFDEAWQEGTWKEGKRWGTFTFTWTDGVVILQYFRADQMVAERALPMSESNLSVLALRQHVVNAESARDRLRTELNKTTELFQGLKKDMTHIRSLHDKTASELTRLQAELKTMRAENSDLKAQAEAKSRYLEEANGSVARISQALEKTNEKVAMLEREEKGAKLRLERSNTEHKKTVDSLTSQLQAITEKYNLRKQQLRQLLPLQGKMQRVRKKKDGQKAAEADEEERPPLTRTRSGNAYTFQTIVNKVVNNDEHSAKNIANDDVNIQSKVSANCGEGCSSSSSSSSSCSSRDSNNSGIGIKPTASNSSSESGSSSGSCSNSVTCSSAAGELRKSKRRFEAEDADDFGEEEMKGITTLWDSDEQSSPRKQQQSKSGRTEDRGSALVPVPVSPSRTRAEEFICACGLRFEFSYQLRVHQKREGHTNPDPNAPLPSAPIPAHDRGRPPLKTRRSAPSEFACSCGKVYLYKASYEKHISACRT